MKKIFFSIIFISIITPIFLILILSTVGYETDNFNKVISTKITENNKNIYLKLEKIKFRFDIKNFRLFLETKEPTLNYHNLKIPIKNINVYVNFISLIKSNPQIEKIDISSKEINIDKLKKIFVKTKPSNLNRLITNKIKNGQILINLELYFNNELDVENYIARGSVQEMSAIIGNNLTLTDTSFNFFADNSDILIRNIKSEMDGFLLKNGNLQIVNKKNIIIKSEFDTSTNIGKKNVNNYLAYLKKIKHVNKNVDFKTNLNHNLDITFDDTYKIINYSYIGKGKIKELNFKPSQSIKSTFLENDINSIGIKNSDLNIKYNSDKKNSIDIAGSYRFNDYDYKDYNLKNNFYKKNSNVEINLEIAQKLSFNILNYKKNKKKNAKISSIFNIHKDGINFKKINYIENNNLISIEKLKIDKRLITSIKKIKVKTFIEDNLNNDFTVNFENEIKIYGNKFDATNLNKILNKKSTNNIFKKITKKIDIKIANIQTPLSKKLENFRLIGSVEKGKFVKISSKGDFGNNKFLDITLKRDKKNKKKYLEIYSDLPQPLLSEYSFFKGLSEGTLIFSSIIDKDTSSSKLTIENFKIINAPGVVKLLSLADFGGLADLAEGEGLTFEKLEINMTKDKNFLKLDELYAVGPSVSVLMDGYKEASGLTSLRGTLVPAKNLNKLLSKIPIIGKIIIPKDVGEGLFGVSFKMKGLPGNIKTSINPIKTLTPRFITKALEKSKKTK